MNRRACSRCGRGCRTISGVCAGCQRARKTGLQVRDPIALAGGYWAPQNGIQVWQKFQCSPALSVAAIGNNESRGHDVSRPPSGAATPVLRGLADRKDTTDS